MSKTATTLIIIAIVAVLLGVLIFALQSENSNTNQSNDNSSNVAANSDSTNANRKANTNASALNANSTVNALNEVSVTKAGFVPKILTVSAGQKVNWTNNDTVVHYIAPADHPTHIKYAGIWDDDGTGRIAPGETYTATISVPGTYSYHDHLNPTTTGTLIVE